MFGKIVRSLYVPASAGERVLGARYGYEMCAPSYFFLWMETAEERRRPTRIDVASFLKGNWGNLTSKRRSALEKTMSQEMDIRVKVGEDGFEADTNVENPDLEVWVAKAKSLLEEEAQKQRSERPRRSFQKRAAIVTGGQYGPRQLRRIVLPQSRRRPTCPHGNRD